MKRYILIVALILFSCSTDDEDCDRQAIMDKYEEWLDDPTLSDRQYDILIEQRDNEIAEACN